MNRDTWFRVKQLLEDALARPESEREAYLAASCDGDPRLQREVMDLLAVETNPLFEDLTGDETEPESEDCLLLGTVIGPYVLREVIGRGGMGTVYLGVRDDDLFEQRVAIKMLSVLSRPQVALFQRERQILAQLNHPNIATLLDAGNTEDGQPYLVMEYVAGEPLVDYCQHRDLTVEDRLRLFQMICGAVQYAHQNLVVHRDLKPSNILITPDGTPKLLDFGIAKLLSVDETTRHTVGLVLTPHYASPEQVEGTMINTSSDIYSLGVLLYEMLSGRLPHDFDGCCLAEIRRVLAEEEPLPPSEALWRGARDEHEVEAGLGASGAGRDRSKIGHLRRQRQMVKGDLDQVVSKALRKEPGRRYKTVEQFREDIDRFLSGHPVIAGRSSWGGRLFKFVRRHRLAVSTGCMVFLLLAGFSLAMRAQQRKTAHERDLAREARYLLVEVLSLPDPLVNEDEKIDANKLLTNAVSAIRNKPNLAPESKAELLHAIGKVYSNLSLFGEALPILEEALRGRIRVLGPHHLDVGFTAYDLGLVHLALGNLEDAETAMQKSLEVQRHRSNRDGRYVFGWMGLGKVALANEDFVEAEVFLSRALELRPQDAIRDPEEFFTLLNDLASAHHIGKRREEAARIYRKALDLAEREASIPRVAKANTQTNYAQLMIETGAFQEAETLMEEVMPVLEETTGLDHELYAFAWLVSANLFNRQGKYLESSSAYSRLLDLTEKIYGPSHRRVAVVCNSLGLSLLMLGEYSRAESYLLRSRAIREQILPSDDRRLVKVYDLLALCWVRTGRVEEAESLARRALEILSRQDGKTCHELARSHRTVAIVALEKDDYDRAREHLGRAFAILASSDNQRLQTTLYWVQGRLFAAEGRLEEAWSSISIALEISSEVFGSSHVLHTRNLKAAAEISLALGECTRSASLSQQAAATLAEMFGETNPLLGKALALEARALRSLERGECPEGTPDPPP